MATVKKSVKKAADGSKQPPTYKNLKMGVANSRKESTPTKQDSALYRFGYNRGLRGEKEYPNEPPIQKMGRWEGQNVGKKKMKTGGTLAPSKKSVGKTIGKLNKAKSGGSFPDLNKDGKVTKKDVLIGRGVLPKTAKKGKVIEKSMKMGGKAAKQAAIAISMKKAGKTPKAMMKMGGKTKKCAYGCK